MSSSILVMVPTLNEELGIRKVLDDMPKGLMVLVVDGGSTDNTVEVAKQCQVIVIEQKFGLGLKLNPNPTHTKHACMAQAIDDLKKKKEPNDQRIIVVFSFNLLDQEMRFETGYYAG